MKGHRYELFFGLEGWVLVDRKKGEEWKIADYEGDEILGDNPYGKKAYELQRIEAVPIPNDLAEELLEHKVKLVNTFEPEI